MKDEILQKMGEMPDAIFPENYRFNLSDFALFLSVMKNKEAYENVLSIILNEENLRLKEVKQDIGIFHRR